MPEHGLSSAYRLEDGFGRRLRRRCRGGAWWPDWAWGWATRSGSAWGSGSRRGVGLGVGAAVAAAVAVASGVAAAVVAVGSGGLDLAQDRAGRTGRRGRRQGQPAVGDTNATDRRKAPIRARTDPAIAGVTIRAAADSVERLGHGHRAAHVARAVDVSAGQADELLLAQRLGHRSAEGRASVRLVRCLDGDAEAIAIVDRAEERADPLVRRGLVNGLATQGVGRPRGRPGIVHPDGMGLLGRRRIVLHARSSLPPGAATARSLVPFAPCRFAQGGARLRRLSRRERRRRSESRVPTQPWPSRSP